jgi:hypothetical protein
MGNPINVSFNAPTPSVDALPQLTEGLKLGVAVVKAVDDKFVTDNDTAHEHAVIEKHAQDAVDNLNAQIQKAATGSADDKAAALAQIRRMAQPVIAALLCFVSFALTACNGGGLLNDTPVWSDPKTAYYDATTPSQYGSGWNSGILDEVQGRDGLVFVITRDRAAREKKLGYAPPPYTDKYGNHVFTLEVSIIEEEYKIKQSALVKSREAVK